MPTKSGYSVVITEEEEMLYASENEAEPFYPEKDSKTEKANPETASQIGCILNQEKNERNRQLISEAQAGDEKAMETLIVENTGLVRSVALRFCGRGTEYEDLCQIGTIGMFKAINSFSLERGTAFSTYAVPLIIGEIRRHLRDDGIIKVSRSYRKLGVQLMRVRNEILLAEEREPSVRELAQSCGVSAEEAAVALDAVSPVRSLNEPLSGDGGEGTQTLGSLLPDEDSAAELERLQDRLALSQAIARMEPLWQKIILLRYYRDRTQEEVAAQLGLSQVKISREEKKIFAYLRSELA